MGLGRTMEIMAGRKRRSVKEIVCSYVAPTNSPPRTESN
ncbi:hypothetical protein BTZ20_3733 [Rhodococcus sp. MTM3W5.2]|nr:hypothetical protein BTZ20_3733 [Rhodococcus sp. MTM3W5.2]